MAGQQRGIQTVELSGEILKLICASKKSLSLSEIADYLNLAPGSAYKYLVSLQRTGLLKRNESTLEFEAGPLSLRLGLSKINHDQIIMQSRHALTQIAEKYEVNVFASLWSDINGPTVVFYREYAGFYNLGFRLGIHLTLSTATGRLFAAHKIKELRHLNQLKFYTADAHLFSDPTFQAGLSEIRQLGYSGLFDTPTPGISSFAIPVFDASNQMIFAMTFFARTTHLTTEKVQLLIQELKAISQALTGQ